MSANNKVEVGAFTVAPNFIHEEKPRIGIYRAIPHGIWVQGDGLHILLRERRDHSWEVRNYITGQYHTVKADLVDLPIQY